MITILGTVYRVIYASPKNDFCVFIVRDFQNEDHPCAGNIEAPKVGDELEIKGTMVVHKKYGRQIRVESMQRIMPDTMAGARRYLENLGVKGLGPKTLDKILDYFNESILDVLQEENPMAILGIPNVGKRVREDLYRTLIGEGVLQDINEFFATYHMSNRWSRKLYEVYGAKAV